MPTPKKTRKAAAPAPEPPLEAMDFRAFIETNLQDRGYTELAITLDGADGMFSLGIQGKNVHGAQITTALKFTRAEAIRACFQATEAMAEATTYADHQDITTPDFQP